MIKKFNLINSSIFYIFLLSTLYFSYIFFITDIKGDWRTYIDSEILWPYNVLLILSGEKIEFSAYGFFYFNLEHKFFQFLDLINYLKVSNIENLNNGINFSGKLENLIIAGRFFNVLIIYLTLIIVYLIFKSLTKDNKLSFLLCVTYMFTPGIIAQIAHARIDVLASTLLIISYFFLIRFSENRKKFIYTLFITFLFLSIYTKVQSYIFIIFLLISSLYFIKEHNGNKEYQISILTKVFIILFILYCIIYPMLFHRHAKFSLLFLYSQLFFVNLYVYVIFKNNKNFINYNLILTFITFLTLIILIFIINNISYMNYYAVRSTFLEPMEMRMYIGENLSGTDVITLDIKKNLLYFFTLFEKIASNFWLGLKLTLTKYNSNSLLLLLNSLLILYYYFFKGSKKDLLLFLPLVSFFSINGINLIRGSGLNGYLTYSEFFLFIPLCVYLFKSNIKLKKIITICIIFSLTTPVVINPNNYNSIRFQKSDQFNIWCPHFLDSYTKKISRKEIDKICN